MTISFYQTLIPSFIQITESTLNLIDKAEQHCKQQQMSPSDLIEACLIEDMLPFSYQIRSVRHHSMGAIEGVRSGVFSPPPSETLTTFEALRQKLQDSLRDLQNLEEEEINSFVGKPMRFEAKSLQLNFIAEEFLLSFSQPNFYFHATTAYDILRHKGVNIGKLDYLGNMRMAQKAQ